jgi:hypothetical protein
MELTLRILFEQSDVGLKLDRIIQNQERMTQKLMALQDQLTQLQTAVADVKQASDGEAVRVDKIIAALEAGGGDNPAVAQAITDLEQTAATLRAFHADTTPPPEPVTPAA